MKPSLIVAASLSLISFAKAEETKQMPVTAEQQKAMTPDAVLKNLMDGNQRFAAGKITPLNIKASLEASSRGQFPSAVILSCLNSRVPVENVFDQGIGDVFVGRIAGNVENTDLLGSFEFATKLAGAKLILVLGHEACGAVKGACDGAEKTADARRRLFASVAKGASDDVEMSNLTDLLEKIKPAVDAVKDDFKEDERNSKNADFVNKVIEENVRITVADIRKDSPILAEMEKAGDIKIVGGVYSLHTGEVTLLD